MKTKHTKAPKADTVPAAYAPSHWTREASANSKVTAATNIYRIIVVAIQYTLGKR